MSKDSMTVFSTYKCHFYVYVATMILAKMY